MKKLTGMGVAMITPFTAGKEIDFPALKALTEHLIDNGTDFLVVQGTTGESPTLSKEEKRSILDFVIEVNQGRLPVVFGLGGNNTLSVAKELETLDTRGLDGILSVSPYYNKPTQEGIYRHYQTIAGSTDLPIILYNVPGRTGSNVTAETTLKLAHDVKNIAAVKEASGDLFQMEAIIQDKPEDFIVLSGDDGLLLSQLALGADGVISVVGNAFPREFSKMVSHGVTGNINDARSIHYQLRTIIDLLFKEGNPAGIKETLKHLNICDVHVRLPLVPASKELSDMLLQEMKKKELMNA